MFTPNLRHSMMMEDSFRPLHRIVHKTLWDDGEHKLKEGITSLDELVRVLGPRDP